MNTFGFYKDKKRNVGNYTIKKGDSLFKISQKYNLNMKNIISDNDVKTVVFYPEQVIVIPRNNNNGVYFEEYIIANDDTIISISQKLNIPFNVLIKHNDFSKLLLKEGQTIHLPIRSEAYTVSVSDNLNTILSKFNLTIEELVNLNAQKWLRPGEEVKIK